MTKPYKQNRYRAFMATITADLTDISKLRLLAEATHAKYAIMLHDLDQGSSHYHVSLYYDHAKTINAVAKQLQISPNFIQKWDNRIWNLWSYLLHDTDDAKKTKQNYSMYLQDINKFNTNLSDFILRATKPAKEPTAPVDLIIVDILDGKLTEQQLLTSDYIHIYHQNKRKIDDAIRLYTKSLIYNPPPCTTIYIYGDSGIGKTTLAQNIATDRYPDSHLFASHHNDPLQEYSGQKCLILDDFRPQNYELIDLLAMLDPYHRKRTHKSRYYNKPLATNLIIITSTYSLSQTLQFYSSYNEQMTQLERRIQEIRYLDNNNDWIIAQYSKQLATYVPI